MISPDSSFVHNPEQNEHMVDNLMNLAGLATFKFGDLPDIGEAMAPKGIKKRSTY